MSEEKGNIFRENQLLWKLVNASYDGMFLTDSAGIVVYCNDSYQRISGLNREKIIGRQISDLVKDHVIPDAVSPDVIAQKKPLTKVINYYHGVSALVTGTPIFDGHELVWVLSNVRDITQLNQLKEQVGEYSRRLRQAERAARDDNKFLAVSKEMETIVKTASRVASFSSPVLIQGESGVGKDMLARYIHDCSDVSENRPFVQINCSAIPETLLESELFGYEAGAFTGASNKGKMGLWELADNGTLFLDEIGEMPLSLQVKMLHVLQTGTIIRIGGTKNIKLNTRIIAASNSNLEKLMAVGRFRQDLYYRLNVIPFRIPPLRERKADLLPLMFYFLEKKNIKFNLNRKLSANAVEVLSGYDWPGNVRELNNMIEHLMIVTEGDVIDGKNIPQYIIQAVKKPLYIDTPDYFNSFNLDEIITTVEREVIRKAITEFGALRNVSQHLGIDLSTLVRKKRKYKL
ncbi:MAG: sigma-54 interaction domain-containing protein [Negativicutes bacterium]